MTTLLLNKAKVRPTRSPTYTTGAASKICNVAPRTVSQWVDSGMLKGHRLPGSQDRRIAHDDLVRFMRQHGMDSLLADLEDSVTTHLLAVGILIDEAQELDRLLPTDWAVARAGSLIEAGQLWEKHEPAVVLAGLGLGRTDACNLAHWFSQQEPRPRLVGLVPDDGWDGELDEIAERYGWDALLKDPSPETLIEALTMTQKEESNAARRHKATRSRGKGGPRRHRARVG